MLPQTDDWRSVARRVSNWGRWGDRDQQGTLNFITAKEVRRAAELLEYGHRISLSIEMTSDGPMGAYGDRQNPLHVMTELAHNGFVASSKDVSSASAPEVPARFADDAVTLHTHGATHWDALAHCHYDGYTYNGFPADSIGAAGARHCGITEVGACGGVVGRGVLLDVARHRAVPWLPTDALVTPEELDDVARAQHVELRRGDIVLVRTGWWGRYAQMRDRAAWAVRQPGLSWRCAELLHEASVAAVAADNLAVESHDEEATPASWSSHTAGVPYLLHMLALRDMGLLLGELWDLELLSDVCARLHRHEFMIVAAPLPLRGAVGGPVHPVALL